VIPQSANVCAPESAVVSVIVPVPLVDVFIQALLQRNAAFAPDRSASQKADANRKVFISDFTTDFRL
jgi:hypothetical protein